jgi:sugar phosphate isomerase/epimerase
MGFLTLNRPPAGNASPLDTVEAAAAGGFKSVGLRITGRRPEDEYPSVVGNPAMIRKIRDLASDKGLRLSSTIGYGFFPDLKMGDHARVVEATAELGINLVMLNVYFEQPLAFIDTFAEFCALAKQHRIRVGIEFMPFSGLKTIEQSDEVITRSGAKNGGIIVDALHLARSGGSPADLAKIDPARIFIGQICDGKKTTRPPTDEELRAEARAHRLYPGEGDFLLHELVAALPAGIELEYEVPRSDQDGMPLAERAKKAFAEFTKFVRAGTRD